jgi:hypothetical protein
MRMWMAAVAVLVPLGVLFLVGRLLFCESCRVRAQHVALAQWQETGKAVPGWRPQWLWAHDRGSDSAEEVAPPEAEMCESCGSVPAAYRIRMGQGTFAVCSGCAPLRQEKVS